MNAPCPASEKMLKMPFNDVMSLSKKTTTVRWTVYRYIFHEHGPNIVQTTAKCCLCIQQELAKRTFLCAFAEFLYVARIFFWIHIFHIVIRF